MKPSLPQGNRDFAANTLYKRSFIINTIKSVFELYGFEPLETPAMENLETLMGKYGDEGDKLIFKILNNGLDNPVKIESARKNFENVLSGKNDKNITERALRYDLTIPFARYVAMNYGQLTLPYKRYQIQPVWRADRPQKGRYREFYQCDADVAGTYSLISDAEFALIYATVFDKLKLPVTIRINNRKVLSALAEVCGNISLMNEITATIDKLDKIGEERVLEEIGKLGLSEKSVSIIKNYINIDGDNVEKLEKIEQLISTSETGKEGIGELKTILQLIGERTGNVAIDFTLARGLNYYTGTIYEVIANNVSMGSIGGGGRYNDLTGLFDVPNVPGVGISFGLDRIYDVMEELNIFPESIAKTSVALFFNLGEKESQFAFNLMQTCRNERISCELFYENSKMDKQFKYATKKGIQFAVIIGSQELNAGNCVVKNLSTGVQSTMAQFDLVKFLKAK